MIGVKVTVKPLVRARQELLSESSASPSDAAGSSGHRVAPRLENLGRISLSITRWSSHITTSRTSTGRSNTTSLVATPN